MNPLTIPEPKHGYTFNFLRGMSLFLNKNKYRGVVISPKFYEIKVYLASMILTKEENQQLKEWGWVEEPDCTWSYPEEKIY